MPIDPMNTITSITGRTWQELAWQENALCAQTGPEFFFPAPGSSTREAKQLCGACEGRRECLEYALDNDERFGVWGGLSEKERERLRRSGAATTAAISAATA
ncbi:WhiB family transcriptional regulator [Streptomyces niveus]|jgi:WhiB family transcriptional regulator, redox-sensing transcriptional regulator|nr:WhiB family transcriptional regulator [Streptomyces niveus]EST32080.1 transcription factor WhiB [Streptomyces niveus NCIMB 11891]WTA62969.1 WhiB family transcriptional regulator [Streptomyces niveus]